jgi:hypothetical protein
MLKKPLKPIMIVLIKDYSDGNKKRLVQEYAYTTRTPKKKYRYNITATIRKPKTGDHANAGGRDEHRDSVIMKYTKDGFTLIEKNMAEGVIYGWWTSGIVFHAVKKKGVLSITPTKKGVR